MWNHCSSYPENRGRSWFLWNIGTCLKDYTASCMLIPHQRRRQKVPLIHWCTSSSLHSITIQKTVTFIFITFYSSNIYLLIKFKYHCDQYKLAKKSNTIVKEIMWNAFHKCIIFNCILNMNQGICHSQWYDYQCCLNQSLNSGSLR
jgi:hypothetical protein